MTGSTGPTKATSGTRCTENGEAASARSGVVAPVIIYVGLCVILAIACAALLLAVLAA